MDKWTVVPNDLRHFASTLADERWWLGRSRGSNSHSVGSSVKVGVCTPTDLVTKSSQRKTMMRMAQGAEWEELPWKGRFLRVGVWHYQQGVWDCSHGMMRDCGWKGEQFIRLQVQGLGGGGKVPLDWGPCIEEVSIYYPSISSLIPLLI